MYSTEKGMPASVPSSVQVVLFYNDGTIGEKISMTSLFLVGDISVAWLNSQCKRPVTSVFITMQLFLPT